MIFFTSGSVWSVFHKEEKYDFFMPNVQPKASNVYLCTPVKINPENSYYIVGFEPHASMEIVHHMIVYGCPQPGMNKSVWNCGEMANSGINEDTASPCDSGSTVLYAWARDAPMLKLPEGVAFKVGKNTRINYMVLQIHYGHVNHFKDGYKDTSGLYLHFTNTPLPRSAGVLLLGTDGRIQPHKVESMETACLIKEDKLIYPFAFRVHTHELGVRVAGYRVRKIDGNEYWTLIGERDPLLPQMFYPVEEPLIIKGGDSVAAVCKMDATHRNRTTFIGSTSNDEMCNFYMMYWVEDDAPLKQQYCFTMGPPYYFWQNEFQNIPEKEQSVLYLKHNNY